MSKLVLRFSCILALIAFALPAPSQVQNGEFIGLITDPSGAVINQARVLIHNLGTGFTQEVRSNEDGVYTGRELIVGHYQISVEMPGFRTATSGTRAPRSGWTPPSARTSSSRRVERERLVPELDRELSLEDEEDFVCFGMSVPDELALD